MMSDHPVSAACPAFTIQDCFLETAFEVRFQGLLRSAKNPRRGTHIPVLVIRAPKNGGKDLAMGMALCAAFGIVPAMPWYVRRSWLIHALAEAEVQCLIIDEALYLNLAHLAFLKEVTDNLAAPPYERKVSLCLVAAHTGTAIPLKEIFSRPDTRLPTISSSPGY